ncbi:alcohol dehydrogenase catalytic domain-containing protein [Deinococcus sp. HMF7604]|uniref:alcohol dehydrogenase catalytic domain-containing protein n=1 Tax=Deinococcus betulae TaxID=2873312 RepID=UPI001CCA45EA|nr:alcohol dehydrogenase catalytic domain-containing protein [Deinococcus betulae]MBZ9753370.1 alcohol dehydrogenase catalytic domain-containing protein [Deinococcus betulae]
MPQPGPGQVRVRVEATGVNYADVLARRGGYGPGGRLPFVPGLDAAGVVDALGEDVTGLAVGQRVACFTIGGSYATEVLAPATFCLPLADEGLPSRARHWWPFRPLTGSCRLPTFSPAKRC